MFCQQYACTITKAFDSAVTPIIIITINNFSVNLVNYLQVRYAYTNQYVLRALMIVATVLTSFSVCFVLRSADFRAFHSKQSFETILTGEVRTIIIIMQTHQIEIMTILCA